MTLNNHDGDVYVETTGEYSEIVLKTPKVRVDGDVYCLDGDVGISARIDGMDTRLDALNTTNEALKTKDTELSGRIDTLNTTDDALKTEDAALGARIDSLIPPKCVPPGGDKLNFNGTDWLCVCMNNWEGATCENPMSLTQQQGKLTASDGAPDGFFGRSVSTSGDYAVIGGYGHQSYRGHAYIFYRSGTAWTQQQKLTAPDASMSAKFGESVSISGDTAIVGASWAGSKGAAYVFVRSGTTWTHQQKLTVSDYRGNPFFGNSVSISGDTVLVAASNHDNAKGAAYVFVRSGNAWTQQQKLTASDGTNLDYFGTSVSISGDYAIVGSDRDDDDGDASGSAYIFVRSGNAWTQQQKLTASDGATLDYFGSSVSISGDYAIVGSKNDDDNGFGSGSAYIFVRSGIAWTQQQKLKAADAVREHSFGWSVSISGDTALVAAPNDDNIKGAAYLFVRSGTIWTEQGKIVASDRRKDDFFGSAVSISNSVVVVGTHNAESAYVFT